MRLLPPTRRASRRALSALVCAVLCTGAACGGGDDAPEPLGPNSTASDPGPNSTDFDPGPNSTDDGPQTLDGRLAIAGECLTLQRDQGPLDLRFDGYQVRGTELIDADGVAIAKHGDRIAVAGYPKAGQGACGKRFDVTSFVSVIAPAGG
jgi:hypothetical protein